MGGKKRVAILGAGCSGIAAIKCCMDEDLEPVCFEKSDRVGGLWFYTEHRKEDEACVMKSTINNMSKEMMCYSDFPIPRDFPNYMHNTKVVEYFNLYVHHFNLLRYVRFKTSVLNVRRAADYDQTGRWSLQIKDLSTNEVSTELVEGVMLCSGHHTTKILPTFDGMDTFKGSIVHTHEYKSHEGYENKRVVVVGMGNSGVDVASELGKVSKLVYLVARRGSWIFHKVGDNGLPFDSILTTRMDHLIRKIIPEKIQNIILEKVLNKRFDHELYGLRPNHRALNAHPTISDELPSRIISGTVIIKPNITKMGPSTVQFEDGSEVEDVDDIVLATGYKFGFPYLEEGIIDVEDNKSHLYKYVFPPHLKHPTLSAIGFVQPWGPIVPISELQCRWAARLIKGDAVLPNNEEMWRDVKQKASKMAERYVTSSRHTIQVDYVSYMDELAEQIGCKPDINRLILTDPRLAWRILFDPATSYQYRLHGPYRWTGARDAMMTIWDRAYYPLKTKPTQTNDWGSMIYCIIFILIALLITYCWW